MSAVDQRQCAHHRLGAVRLTVVQRGDEVEGQVEFRSDQSEQLSIEPFRVTGSVEARTLSLHGSERVPTPWGDNERIMHDWVTVWPLGTNRMLGKASWTVRDADVPVSGQASFSTRVYQISDLRRMWP